MEPIFALIIIHEKCLEEIRELHIFFVDLEKACGRVTDNWYSGPLEREYYITAVEYMLDTSRMEVRTLAGGTKAFQLDAGILQGSDLRPFLSIVILDVLTECIGTCTSNAMIFAHDFVIREETKYTTGHQIERWIRYVRETWNK